MFQRGNIGCSICESGFLNNLSNTCGECVCLGRFENRKKRASKVPLFWSFDLMVGEWYVFLLERCLPDWLSSKFFQKCLVQNLLYANACASLMSLSSKTLVPARQNCGPQLNLTCSGNVLCLKHVDL